MEKYSYYREQQHIISQFVAAFDGTFVYRYTKDFQAKEKINVRYVFGPKHRVLYDIVNQAKNMTLPVISIEQTNLKRDSSRIQFKDQKITRPNIDNNKLISRITTPVPVSMDLNVSIVCNYKEDIDQIVSNFIPWCNPYFIISWKIPEDFGMDFTDELRTEVTWSGSVDFENPTNIASSDKYKIIGNTSFNVKGWIFPALETPIAPIYVINNNFVAVSSGAILNGYDDYYSLSANDSTDSILISAYPEFTNCFINGKPYNVLYLNDISNQTFTFFGKRFGFTNTWCLSSNVNIPELVFQEIDTVKFPTISGYKIPDEFITTVNDNIVSITLDTGYLKLSGGTYKFITSNIAGWGSSCEIIIDTNNLLYNGIEIVYNGEPIVYNSL